MKSRLIYLSVLLSLVAGCTHSITTQSTYPAITKRQIIAVKSHRERNKLIMNKVIIPGNHKLAEKLLDTIQLDTTFSCVSDTEPHSNWREVRYQVCWSKFNGFGASRLQPLIFPIANNDVEMVKILLKGTFSLRPIGSNYGSTKTYYDYFAGRFAGLEINKMIYDLYYTTENGKYKSKPLKLVTVFDRPDAFDKKIHVLVQNPHIDVLQFWLDKGVDIIDYSGGLSGATRPNDKMDTKLTRELIIEKSPAYHHIRRLLMGQDIERLNLLIQYSDELRKVIPAMQSFAQLNNLHKVDYALAKYLGIEVASDNPMSLNPEYTDVRAAVKSSLMNNNLADFLNFSEKLFPGEEGIGKFSQVLADHCLSSPRMTLEICQQLFSRPFMKPTLDSLLSRQDHRREQDENKGHLKEKVKLGLSYEGYFINRIIKNSKDSDLDYVKYLFSIGMRIDEIDYLSITGKFCPKNTFSCVPIPKGTIWNRYEYKGSNKVKSYLSSKEFIRDIEDYKINKELTQLYATNNEAALIAFLVKNQGAMRLIKDEQLKEKVDARLTQLIGPEKYNIENISQIIAQGATNEKIIQHIKRNNFKYRSKFMAKQKRHLQAFGLEPKLIQAIETHTKQIEIQEKMERRLARLEEERLEAIEEAEEAALDMRRSQQRAQSQRAKEQMWRDASNALATATQQTLTALKNSSTTPNISSQQLNTINRQNSNKAKRIRQEYAQQQALLEREQQQLAASAAATPPQEEMYTCYQIFRGGWNSSQDEAHGYTSFYQNKNTGDKLDRDGAGRPITFEKVYTRKYVHSFSKGRAVSMVYSAAISKLSTSYPCNCSGLGESCNSISALQSLIDNEHPNKHFDNTGVLQQ